MSYQKGLLDHIITDHLTGGTDSEQFATAISGAKTSGNYPKWNSDGNLTDGDAGGGGGSGNLFGWRTLTAPPSSGWTALNSASVSTFDNSRIISAPASASNNIRAEVRTLSGDFTVDAGFSMIHASTNFAGCGLILRESGTGKIVIYQLRQDGTAAAEKWTNFSTFSAAYTPSRVIFKTNPSGFKMTFGPTNRVIEYTNGSHRVTFHSVAKHDFATTAFDQWGYFANTSNSQPVDAELFHMEIS